MKLNKRKARLNKPKTKAATSLRKKRATIGAAKPKTV
jgi:hypothetical protein